MTYNVFGGTLSLTQSINHTWMRPLELNAENYTIVSSFVWTQYRSVTEWQRDRRTDGRTESLQLVQRSALRAMRTRCKMLPGFICFVLTVKLN